MNTAQQLAALGFKPNQIAQATERGKPLDVAGNALSRARFDVGGRIMIFVPGPPPGKPRMTRRDRWAKRPRVVRYREWCDLVRSIAGTSPNAESVATLIVRAFFEPPQSWPKKRRCAVIGEPHRQTPDVDNVAKAVMDCLWPESDSAISSAVITKQWDWTARLEIEIVLARKNAKG